MTCNLNSKHSCQQAPHPAILGGGGWNTMKFSVVYLFVLCSFPVKPPTAKTHGINLRGVNFFSVPQYTQPFLWNKVASSTKSSHKSSRCIALSVSTHAEVNVTWWISGNRTVLKRKFEQSRGIRETSKARQHRTFNKVNFSLHLSSFL